MRPEDADEALRRKLEEEAEAFRPESSLNFHIEDWAAVAPRFMGQPPKTAWLVSETIPLRVPGMVAAMGDLGKSFLLVDLAMRVTCGEQSGAAPIFGGHVVANGA